MEENKEELEMIVENKEVEENKKEEKTVIENKEEVKKTVKKVDTDDNEDEEENENEEDVEEESKNDGFNRKFLLKLMTACPRVQKYYNDFRNELSQYKALKFKSNNTGDTYSFKNRVILKITVFPKALKVYYALDPKKYSVTKFHHRNVKDIKKYENISLLLRVSSDRSYKYSLDLLNDLVKKVNVAKKGKEVYDYLSEFKTTSKELLIAHGGEELLRTSCTKESSIIISDALAKKCVLLENREASKSEKVVGEISIGELSAAFKSSYVIDLNLLKEVGLINNDVNYLKVNAMNNCYKAINVKADEFEPEAIRMIVVTGGNVTRMVS